VTFGLSHPPRCPRFGVAYAIDPPAHPHRPEPRIPPARRDSPRSEIAFPFRSTLNRPSTRSRPHSALPAVVARIIPGRPPPRSRVRRAGCPRLSRPPLLSALGRAGLRTFRSGSNSDSALEAPRQPWPTSTRRPAPLSTKVLNKSLRDLANRPPIALWLAPYAVNRRPTHGDRPLNHPYVADGGRPR